MTVVVLGGRRGKTRSAYVGQPVYLLISFVCTASKETSNTVCLASYHSPHNDDDLLNTVTIWQACRATSAATTFFDPIAIGPLREEFVDGALGTNNPVYALWNEAQDMWGKQMHTKLKCLVSIGTGVPGMQPMRKSLRALQKLVTETERTAQQFHRDKSNLDDEGRYFRFNVDHGLEEVGLHESKKKNVIAAATRLYLESQTVFKQIKTCANSMASQECKWLLSQIYNKLIVSHPDSRSRPHVRRDARQRY